MRYPRILFPVLALILLVGCAGKDRVKYADRFGVLPDNALYPLFQLREEYLEIGQGVSRERTGGGHGFFRADAMVADYVNYVIAGTAF